MRKRFFFVLIVSNLFLLSAAPAYADNQNCTQTDLGCIPNDPVGFVQKFYGLGLSLIGSVVLLFLIIGGYFILTSQGDPERLAKGKGYIYYSLAGLALAVFGFVLIQVITGNVLRIPGF